MSSCWDSLFRSSIRRPGSSCPGETTTTTTTTTATTSSIPERPIEPPRPQHLPLPPITPPKPPSPSRPGRRISSTTASTQSINTSIATLLTSPLNLGTAHSKTGTVYILPAQHNNNRLVKIGYTQAGTAETRKQALQSTCACAGLQFQPQPQAAVAVAAVRSYYKLVEKLAHRELRDRRYEFDCASCGRRHREFFLVGRAAALRVVRRWAAFCEMQPWVGPGGSELTGLSEAAAAAAAAAAVAAGGGGGGGFGQGRLKGEWAERLERWRFDGALLSSSFPSPSSAAEDGEDDDDNGFERRLEFWDGFVLGAGFRTWCWYDLRYGCAGLWRHRLWIGLVCVLLGFVATCLWWDKPWLVLGLMSVLVIVLLCTVVSLAGCRSIAAEHLLREWLRSTMRPL